MEYNLHNKRVILLHKISKTIFENLFCVHTLFVVKLIYKKSKKCDLWSRLDFFCIVFTFCFTVHTTPHLLGIEICRIQKRFQILL